MAAAGNAPAQDHWYRYDALGRMVTTKGALVGGVIVRGAAGTDLTYDAAGRRATATTGSAGSQREESYVYDAMGNLTEVKEKVGSGAAVVRASSIHDLLGRTTGYVEYGEALLSGMIAVHNRYGIEYDLRGQVLSEKTLTLQGNAWIHTHTANYYNEIGQPVDGVPFLSSAADIGASSGTVLAYSRHG